ncbi:MAG: hypothetical protein A2649_02010 [Candidatus Yanofskybacteria bacterium RIFCSPHIGHO2_01_FULL_41_26]|uniref:Uncharacterized protein n=1 Tax=Candidatus Yanofskybacteria bacterium RIFCSPHIGHO2_01_FULL_41_26 TaxID=1802661 RepID=A0A1F8EE66_9BACT|nr:MAG: hypothetical protein A2649_02010 [Candidatus Yanofskybacteria bacterium RIFCSPHIGHO2_01_FULL_41_26]
MNQSKTIKFQGHEYFDDRLFVLYLCKGKVDPESEGLIATTIYHDSAPEEYIWCVVTYRNYNRYPLYRIDSFYNKDDAIAYIKTIEPETPLISLGGKPPQKPLSYEDYVAWKKKNNLRDYDWKSLYTDGGSSAREIIYQTREQFKGVK